MLKWTCNTFLSIEWRNLHDGGVFFSLEYRNCYVMNAAELLQSVPDAANTKVSGLLIGCIIDTSIGELSFLAAGQDTGIRFKVNWQFSFHSLLTGREIIQSLQ